MKYTLTYLLPLTLSACMNFSDVEKQALSDRAISDARKQPRQVHLAYLQCYALENVDKDFCQRTIRDGIEGSKSASSWEYILPFDYEAEKLGFATFLREHGKACKGINEGSQYNKEKKAYNVRCNDGHNYSMRFDYEGKKWKIVE